MKSNKLLLNVDYKRNEVSLKVPAKVRPSDRMYKMVKTEFAKKIF